MQFVFSDLMTGSSKDLAEDEVDRLFQKLQQHEPPPDLAQQVLDRIRQLPGGGLPPASSPTGTRPSALRPGHRGVETFH